MNTNALKGKLEHVISELGNSARLLSEIQRNAETGFDDLREELLYSVCGYRDREYLEMLYGNTIDLNKIRQLVEQMMDIEDVLVKTRSIKGEL